MTKLDLSGQSHYYYSLISHDLHTYYNDGHITSHHEECHDKDGAKKEVEVAIVSLGHTVPHLKTHRHTVKTHSGATSVSHRPGGCTSHVTGHMTGHVTCTQD